MNDAPKCTNFGKGGQQYPQGELEGDLDPRVVHGKHREVGSLLVGEGLGFIVEGFDSGEAGWGTRFGLLKLTFSPTAAEEEEQNHPSLGPCLKPFRSPHFQNCPQVRAGMKDQRH